MAPGGQDKFRRKHNADGERKYWLESSDLIQIRKKQESKILIGHLHLVGSSVIILLKILSALEVSVRSEKD